MALHRLNYSAMNTNIDTAFARARSKHQALLCPFFTAGYPNLAVGPQMLLAAQEAGAGCIELGIPFSDPIADGPVIQESYRLALEGGATVEKSLDMLRQARTAGLKIPVLAMVSFSVIFKRGTNEFAKLCCANGVDGLVLPDLPLEEAPAVVAALGEHGLGSSLLIAPSTSPDRRRRIAGLCTAFIYYLSVSGITGERASLPSDIAPNIAQLRQVTERPICVGFGIHTAEQVRQVGSLAEGVIVGSAIIRRLTEERSRPDSNPVRATHEFIASLAAALR